MSASVKIDCSGYELKIRDIFNGNVKINLAEAHQIFDDFESIECQNMLLAYNLLGFVHYNNSNLQEAKSYFQKGEEQYFLAKKFEKDYANNQMFTALVYIVESNYETAIYHLSKASEIADQLEDKPLIAMINLNFGLASMNMNKLDDAERLFHKALTYQTGDSLLLGYAFQNLAVVNLRQSKYDEAIEYTLKSKHIWQGLKDPKGLYFLSLIEADVYNAKGDYNKALDVLRAGRLLNNDEIKLLVGESFLIEAEIHNNLGDKESEIKALTQAILEGDDLDLEEIETAILNLSNKQDYSQTTRLLMQLIAKYKQENLEEKKLAVAKSRVMDSELAVGQSVIKRQLTAIISMAILFLGLCYLLWQLKKQKSQISKLNQNLINSNRQIENQLNSLKEKNVELKQFASVASHDLKSPLRTISSFATLLDKELPPGTSKEYLEFISSASKDMSHMISDLLEYSTIDQKLNLSPTNINELVNSTLVRIKTQIIDAEAEVTVDIDKSIKINSDKIKLSIALQNIISNAISYSRPNEKPIVNISVEEQVDEYKIIISDNGIGIPNAYHDKIFEMFERLEAKKTPGSGIGLATSMKIIKMHNGTIDVVSESESGSKFTITLPKV